jgi:hypothetical protein
MKALAAFAVCQFSSLPTQLDGLIKSRWGAGSGGFFHGFFTFGGEVCCLHTAYLQLVPALPPAFH